MIPSKRIAIVKRGNKYSRAIMVESRDGTAEWARLPDSNLVLFPGTFEEEDSYEVPESFEQIDALALDLTRGRA